MFFSAIILSLLPGLPDAKANPSLSPSWHGTWKGSMLNTGATGKSSKVPVVFTIQPIRDSRSITWKITYGNGKRKVVKDYKLIPVERKPGQFQLDEGNGSHLAARLVGNVLYCHFESGGIFFTARYSCSGSLLHFEVTTARPVPQKTGMGKIQGYDIKVVQTAKLKK